MLLQLPRMDGYGTGRAVVSIQLPTTPLIARRIPHRSAPNRCLAGAAEQARVPPASIPHEGDNWTPYFSPVGTVK
jgi:hypothetical protein